MLTDEERRKLIERRESQNQRSSPPTSKKKGSPETDSRTRDGGVTSPTTGENLQAKCMTVS